MTLNRELSKEDTKEAKKCLQKAGYANHNLEIPSVPVRMAKST